MENTKALPEFKPFQKIARLSRDVIISEKIDGTNASVFIGEDGEFLTASRTRWITPEQDNYGFSRWANEHKDELMKLGAGHHFGEWWGQGIQRKYDMTEKVWSLFNTTRWCSPGSEPKQITCSDPRIVTLQEKAPSCCRVVPVLYEGMFDTMMIDEILATLKEKGSIASKGFMKPEGVVIYHPHGNILFKKTLGDDGGKWLIKKESSVCKGL